MNTFTRNIYRHAPDFLEGPQWFLGTIFKQ